MNAVTDSKQSNEPRGRSIWQSVGSWKEKTQQGIHWTWHHITTWVKKVPKRNGRANGNRHEIEYIVRFVKPEPTPLGSETKLDINLPAELHILRPKQSVVLSLLRKLIDWPILILLLFFLFGLWLWLTYLVPNEYPHEPIELEPANVPIWLSLTYPKYIAYGDEGYIDVTIRNEGDRTISSIAVVDFNDDHVVCMNCSEANKVEFIDLAPHVRQTWRIGFVLNEAPRFHVSRQYPRPVCFDVIVIDTDGNRAEFSGQAINLAPLPYLRKVLVSGGVLGGVLALLLVLPEDWLVKAFSAA
jgi:hypothetical protein